MVKSSSAASRALYIYISQERKFLQKDIEFLSAPNIKYINPMERNTGYPNRMTIRHIPHSCNDEPGDLQNYKPNLVNHLSKNYLDDSCHFFLNHKMSMNYLWRFYLMIRSPKTMGLQTWHGQLETTHPCDKSQFGYDVL